MNSIGRFLTAVFLVGVTLGIPLLARHVPVVSPYSKTLLIMPVTNRTGHSYQDELARRATTATYRILKEQGRFDIVDRAEVERTLAGPAFKPDDLIIGDRANRAAHICRPKYILSPYLQLGSDNSTLLHMAVTKHAVSGDPVSLYKVSQKLDPKTDMSPGAVENLCRNLIQKLDWNK